ncbi:hypothetical protein ACTFIW_003611 [Dictyostelium discoideum]
MSIFAYSILAGLAPLLSSSIPFFTLRNRNINASVFHILLCISAGLLFAVASLELIPESMNLALRSFEESTKTQTPLKSTTTKTTTIGNIKLQKSFISNSEDSLDNDINKAPIEALNLNNLNQATNLDNNEEDNDNLDNDGENENDHDHDHLEDQGGDDDHDHESEEKKEFLKIPMYGIGFGFAILIIVESIFSSIDGSGGGHHSHSHGSLSSSSSNDVISDYISNNNSDNINNDNNNNNNNNNDDDDSVELLERNVVNKDNSNNINNINNNNDEDIIVINKSIENTPNIASPVMNNNNNNNDKDKNRNSNKSDIKNSGSINNGNNSGNNNNNNNNKSKLTITTFIALSIHSFVDGVVISSAFSSSPHVGARVALAIVIHKIPDGLVLSSLILSQKKFNSGIFSNPFFYFLLISCMTPLGSFISSFLFGGLSLSSGAFVLGFGAGTFIYITSTAILPEILSNQIVKKSTSLFSIFLGYLLFIFLDSQFHGAH